MEEASSIEIKLYGIRHSHSVLTARLMLDHKRLRHVRWDILPGLHPLVVRGLGFGGWTVPALRAGRRRVLGTLRIARLLDELEPRRPLFPAAQEGRRAVERAERFGHDVLQPAVRRIVRWAAVERRAVRAWIVRDVIGWPAAGLLAPALKPVVFVFAGPVSGASSTHVREDLAALPGQLDHADALVEAGVIGSPEPSAADFQVLASVRALLALRDLEPRLAGRPCARAALDLAPYFPEPPPRALPPVPEALPGPWLR